MLGKQAHQSEEGNKSSPKKTGLVAALTAVLCLSCAAMYHRFIHDNDSNLVSDEISDKLEYENAQGYAGFHYENTPMTWDEAKEWCLDHEMVLATVDEDWKRAKILSMTGVSVWVGYRATAEQHRTDKNAYRWESGAPTHWAPWAPNEPSSHNGEMCTHMQGWDGKLNNQDCSGPVKFPFVCDKSPFIEGYAMHGQNGDGLRFDEANAECRRRYGTTLATLGDRAEWPYLMSETQATEAWVGMRVIPGKDWSEQNFQWISGHTRAVLKWAQNNPTNSEWHCAMLKNDAKLYSRRCNNRVKRYLCDLSKNYQKSYSSLELIGEQHPQKSYHPIPNKRLFFKGRTKFYFTMKIRINALSPKFAGIFEVGNSNEQQLPGIFIKANQRKLVFRQTSDGHGNVGCNPEEHQTPALNTFFLVEVFSQPGRFEVKYNRQHKCWVSGFTLDPDNDLKAYLSGDVYPAAKVTLKELGLFIS